ncbi:MAG TPA: CBS domain-containing protein [Gemmataceae bacterium]|jgi:CBS domain-containing protein
MRPNPVSIRSDATIREAVDVLTDRGFGAAPVIDEAGRAIGVVSRTDILLREREYSRYAHASGVGDSAYDCTEWDVFPDPSWSAELSTDILDRTTAAEIMTPAIFTVALDAAAREVVRRMLMLKVHHLFVADGDKNLVGVISPLDILRCLAD